MFLIFIFSIFLRIFSVFDNIITPYNFCNFSYTKLNSNYIITFGGPHLDDIYFFSIKKEKWHKTHIKLKNKIQSCCTSKLGNTIHVTGGQLCGTGNDFAKFFKFHTTNQGQEIVYCRNISPV